MLKHYKIVLIFIGCSYCVQASVPPDTTRILIANINIQIETTKALNSLYDFKFDKAEQQFRWLKRKYAWHPLAYFLLGLSQWWKIMPNPYNRSHNALFVAYMDSAIFVAKNLYKKAPEYRIEAAFFLAAANGFKGRLYAQDLKKNWLRAATAGKDALKYLNEIKSKGELSPELLFGDALYNYFTVWIKENYPNMKPLLWFFPTGNKALGLEQLKTVAYNAFYTRTEAMVWLMRIFSSYENEPARALRIAKYLHESYPNNAYFHRYYAKTLYENNLLQKTANTCLSILNRIDSGRTGYSANSGKHASYYLGRMAHFKNELHEAKKYYNLTVNYASLIKDNDSGFYLFALLELGDIYSREGDQKKALLCFKAIMKRSSRREPVFKEAKKKLKVLRKAKKQ